MIRRSLTGMALALSLTGPSAEAQSDARAYKVAFWYELDRPISTIQYRSYNLARGEYDQKAVDRWFRTILEKHPDTGAYVRDLRTDQEPGATEAERLASAIDREKRRWADLNRLASRPIPSMAGPNSPTRDRGKDGDRASFGRPSPGSSGGRSPSPSSPFPYPYRPRPL